MNGMKITRCKMNREVFIERILEDYQCDIEGYCDVLEVMDFIKWYVHKGYADSLIEQLGKEQK